MKESANDRFPDRNHAVDVYRSNPGHHLFFVQDRGGEVRRIYVIPPAEDFVIVECCEAIALAEQSDRSEDLSSESAKNFLREYVNLEELRN